MEVGVSGPSSPAIVVVGPDVAIVVVVVVGAVGDVVDVVGVVVDVVGSGVLASSVV